MGERIGREDEKAIGAGFDFGEEAGSGFLKIGVVQATDGAGEGGIGGDAAVEGEDEVCFGGFSVEGLGGGVHGEGLAED